MQICLWFLWKEQSTSLALFGREGFWGNIRRRRHPMCKRDISAILPPCDTQNEGQSGCRNPSAPTVPQGHKDRATTLGKSRGPPQTSAEPRRDPAEPSKRPPQRPLRTLCLVAPYCAIPRDYLSDTPLLRAMGFLVSQHGQLGAIPPPPFLSVSPLESMRSGGAIPPPPPKGVSQRYWRDTLWKQGKWVRYPPLWYYLERVLRDRGGISHWAAKTLWEANFLGEPRGGLCPIGCGVR